MKTFECQDAGVVCGAKVTGETEDEVLAKAVEHARSKHGVDLKESETLMRFAKGAIRDDLAERAGTSGPSGGPRFRSEPEDPLTSRVTGDRAPGAGGRRR